MTAKRERVSVSESTKKILKISSAIKSITMKAFLEQCIESFGSYIFEEELNLTKEQVQMYFEKIKNSMD